MDSKIIVALIAFVGGLTAGTILPWVKWEIEKRRLQRTRRIELIDEWRMMLSAVRENASDGSKILLLLESHASYESLKAHSKYNPVSTLGISIEPALTIGPKRPPHLDELSKEVQRIEREWGLK